MGWFKRADVSILKTTISNCSDWLAARQQRNDIISLKHTRDEKVYTFLDLYKEIAKRTSLVTTLLQHTNHVVFKLA